MKYQGKERIQDVKTYYNFSMRSGEVELLESLLVKSLTLIPKTITSMRIRGTMTNMRKCYKKVLEDIERNNDMQKL